MLWFLMGYTSKLAGTETGIVDPVSTFSRFFGAPFMPRNPDVYATDAGREDGAARRDRLSDQHGLDRRTRTASGTRMSLPLTRAMVSAALDGKLDDVEYECDPIFKVEVPRSCPGIDDPSILTPVNTWDDPAEYEERARKLAADFARATRRRTGTRVSTPPSRPSAPEPDAIDPLLKEDCRRSH